MLTQLIERYQSFIHGSRKESIDPALQRVYLALHQMERNRSFIDIAIDGDEEHYQSIILSLDPENRTILIDELFPEGFVGLSGQKILVSIRQKEGRKIQFQSIILQRLLQNDLPLYVITMPDEIDLDQRRSAFRLPINPKFAVESSFITPDNNTCRGQLRNLSSSGVCLEVDKNLVPADLAFDDHLTEVSFDFAGVSVDCELAIRAIGESDSKKRSSESSTCVIGAEFVDLPIQEKRMLERSIMRIQRDRIKFSSQQALA